MNQSSKKHSKRKIRARNSVLNQEDERSTRLTTRVQSISIELTIISVFFFLTGGGFLLLFLLSFLKSYFSNSNTLQSDFIPFAVFILFLLAWLLAGIFVLKVAIDFRSFKSWTFAWVQWLMRMNRVFFINNWDDLNNPDVRTAFKQPQFEYPEYPEYGYKLENEKDDRKS